MKDLSEIELLKGGSLIPNVIYWLTLTHSQQIFSCNEVQIRLMHEGRSSPDGMELAWESLPNEAGRFSRGKKIRPLFGGGKPDLPVVMF